MTPVDPAVLGPIESDADGILIYYDGPLLYTTGGGSFLWYWVDASPERYLVAPTDAATIAALEANTLDVRSAVLRDRLYLVIWGDPPLLVFEMTPAEVRTDWVAAPGVRLRTDGEAMP
jgi:hypothetical protein